MTSAALPPAFSMRVDEQLKRRKTNDRNGKNRTAKRPLPHGLGIAGKLVQTRGICDLPPEDQSAIRERVETFEDFTEDNDPYKERDFGAFEHKGKKIFWKIDYYDPTLTKGSEDPADPKQTCRVLTILLADEW